MDGDHNTREVSTASSDFQLIFQSPLTRLPNVLVVIEGPPAPRLAWQLQRSHSVSACVLNSLWGLLFHQPDKQIKSCTQIKQLPARRSHSVALLSGNHIAFDWCLGPHPRIFWCFCLKGATTTCNEAALLHPTLLMCAF